ncbi:MAG: molybdopterin molybdotransferase MoeA [Sphingomonadales bacterium]|nr:molybdopterin molybdotransferase MoeA [Sphingomonadales bacterium]
MPQPLELAEAQARLFALAAPLSTETLAIDEACGRYLAAPLRARRRQPAADLSAMDGYAVAGHEGPWRVIGESAAGHPFAGATGAGEAVRISTGALLPEGASAVLLQEDCAREGGLVRLTGTPPQPFERHIRRAGRDFDVDDAVLAQGVRIGPAQLALAIAAGHATLAVRPRPRLAIIDCGDELARPGEPCPPHRLPASNGPMLAALARTEPCIVTRIGPVADDRAALVAAFEATGATDIIVTSGGASVGDHDLLRPALADWGAAIDWWKVAIKPGKPLLVARRGATIVLGLPGNPASSFVTAHLFLLPLLRAFAGAARLHPGRLTARLAAPLAATGGRREFLRAHWDGARIAPVGNQDSGTLSSLALANSFIDRPARAAALAAGEEVEAFLTEGGTIA